MQRKQKRKRRAYTAAELAEVWDRWGRGEPSDGIARALNRGTNVYTLLARRAESSSNRGDTLDFVQRHFPPAAIGELAVYRSTISPEVSR